MTASASATDRTVQKIALCSAFFAGAAYVGYSVVRQTFGRTLVPQVGARSRGRRLGFYFSAFLSVEFEFSLDSPAPLPFLAA